MASEMTREYRINLTKAIKSLDSLNDQIVQYVFAQNNVDLDLEKDLSPREQETLRSSMILIRSLLNEAQSKFRKMVEDNKQLAVRIDGSIQAANQEVTALRAELADTNKRLSQISNGGDKTDQSTQAENDNSVQEKFDEENELVKLKEENGRLELQVKSLSREVEELRRVKEVASSQNPSYGELKLELIQARQELNRAKDALKAMKADRKRLKGEKLDLLNQMKQLYGTLEDKEAELRDFIRNYEQRVKESDDSIKQLASEKEESECEKWEIIKKARDAAERSVLLRAQLDSKEQQVKKLETELAEMKEKLYEANKSQAPNPNSSSETVLSSDEFHMETPSQSIIEEDSSKMTDTSTDANLSNDISDSITPLLRWFNSNYEVPEDPKLKKKKRSFGSLPKIFSRGRSRRSIALPASENIDETSSPKVTLLTQENYQEKLQVVESLKGCHMAQWKANQVLAWLEISLSMPMYGRACAQNIKSGKVLLGLSDADLSGALGITKPLHRRKLRLGIEEQRDPSEIQFPKCSSVDHTWVALKWLPDLGLPQYSAVMEANLVDGRTLNSLSKKDLEKHLDIHRKSHQASILHAVELLRRLGFDKEMLAERRLHCEDSDSDPLVWTNPRILKWVRSIDLEEYADNLLESGVNGALMVLEPSFTPDTLATALGIPPSKSYVRRHLATELDALIKPARAALDTPNNNTKGKREVNSIGRSFNRSYRSNSSSEETPKGRLSFRGSLGRAFGKKIRDDLRMAFETDTSPKRKISAPIPIQHNHSLDSIVEPESTPV